MGITVSNRPTGRILIVGVMLAVTVFAGLNVRQAQAQPAAPLEHLCASKYTGAIIYQPAGCPPGHLMIDLTAGDVTVCWSPYTGQVSHARTGVCPATTQPLELPGATEVTLCASRHTGRVRFPGAGSCTAGELTLGVAPRTIVYSTDCLTSGDCPQPIPEYFGDDSVDDVLTVSGSTGTITEVTATVDLVAEDVRNVALQLTSPGGTTIALFTQNSCVNSGERMEIVFDDDGVVFNCGPEAGFNAVQPAEALSGFNGEGANGSWTLSISTANDYAGVLLNWSLAITTTGAGANVACAACMAPFPVELTNPDLGAAISSMLVAPPEAGVVADLDVTIDITHADAGDLSLFVVSPQGTSVRLIGLVCDNEEDDLEVIYDDEAAGTLDCANRLGFNSFQPDEPLSRFDGESAAGTWHLIVLDDVFPDVGALDNWALDFGES